MNARKILAVSLSALMMVLVLVLLLASVASAGGPILHRVSAGGPDVCEAFGLKPGCDANFSLQAIQYADGSVSGQYTDQFGHGFGGFHAVIDCLSVDGNQAWVSGLLTHETISGTGQFVGNRVAARLVDNGTSANDVADQISFSIAVDDNFDCTEQPDFAVFDMAKGQVKVE